jgi:cation transport ATPase
MDDNKKKKTDEQKNKNVEDEVEKAQKEMEELMKSIQEEMGGQQVKVVKVQLPRPTIKNFIFGLIISLLINTLLIIGTSGFVNIFVWDSILDLLFFSIYFTFIERTINFIFSKLFMPLIIRSMGLAALIPYGISIALVLIFPLFVIVENLFTSLIMLVFVCICRNTIQTFIQNKLMIRKVRRKK